jgi:pimeloyl-ACP methyl ester carboxylesterase
LNGYTTKESAADIADLKQVLGLSEYNLLTMSYSTKIAQVLMRDFPEGIRSVVMDSPLPLEVQYDEESVANLLNIVHKLLSDCRADQQCASAYPNLRDRFMNYLEQISANPLEVIVQNPETGNNETFRLMGKDLLTVFTSASTDNVIDIPAEMEKVLQGDLTSVQQELQSLFNGPGSGSGQGMRLSVWCAEEATFNSWEKIAKETNRYPAITGLSPAVFSEGVCDVWKVEEAHERENDPVKSEIPVLLISGGYDNETPPEWAAAMLSNLANSQHVVFRGWKHTPTTNWSNPCAMQMANAFFNTPGSRPDLECYDDLTENPFETD